MPRTDWRWLEARGLEIEEAQVVIHKADQPDFIPDLLYADVLTGEHGDQHDLVRRHAEATALGHGDGSIMERVGELAQAAVGSR